MSDITLSFALPFPPPPVAGAGLGLGEGGEVADGAASAFEGLINLPETVSVEGAVDAVCAPLALPGLIAGILTQPAPVTPMTRTESTKMGAENTTVQIESVSKMAEMQLIESSSASLDPPDPMPGPTDLEANVSPTPLTLPAQEAPDVPVQMAGGRAPATPSDAPALPYRPAANAGAVGGDQDAENVQPSVIPFASPAAASPGAPAARPEPAPLRPAIGEPAALHARPAGFSAGVPFAQILSRPSSPVSAHPTDAPAPAPPEAVETQAAKSSDVATAPAQPAVLGGPPQAGSPISASQITGAGCAARPGPALAREGESGPACAPLSDGSDAPRPAVAPLPRKLAEGEAAAVLPADPASAPGPVADTGAGLTDAPGLAGAPAPPHTGLSPSHIPAPPTAPPTAPSASAPLPAAVPAQIVQAAADSGSPVTEIRLSPEELGSLRIELRTEGDRAYVTLFAERADTLDLLRRHSDRLAADFRAAGFAQVDLGFGHWSGPGQGADQAAPAPDGPMLPEAPPPDPAAWPSPVSAPAGAGLYLRL